MTRRISLTWRLTLLFAAASTAVLLGLGALIGRAVEQHFVEQDLELLGGKLELVRHVLEKVGKAGDLVHVPQQLDDLLVGSGGMAIVVIAPDGQRLFVTRDAEFPHALLSQPAAGETLSPTVWNASDNTPFRGLSVNMPTAIPDAPWATVAVATDITHHEHFMAAFRVTLWGFVVLAAGLTGLLGWLAARQGLAPLQAIKDKAAGITARSLHDRLDADAVPVELAALAETLNTMLARLEVSFRRLNDFSSDLAHEFRTPVSNLLTETQVMLSKPRSAEAYRDVLASNIEEFERLSRMIADMLFLAKADEGQFVSSREALDLEALIADLVEYHGLAAEEKGVAVKVTGSARIEGDSLMIRRAISNLLGNAIRHTPPAGRVDIAIRRAESGRVAIDIRNTGETIAAEYLPRLFDRFFRADHSRTGDGTHTGLGLAIVKSIVEAHGGSVSVTSQAGETCFTLTFREA